ncbi:MAG: hypothetical protein IPP04_07065 [Saprospiraceae bacterium]|nr:hypothetical protein [Saprospiraceae bacterium]MBL0112553.1 hypothetical protein [Saprospiraceae bacterium]
MNKVNRSKTGAKLQKLRQICGYEQKYIASILNVQQPYYSKIEAYNPDKHYKFIPLLSRLYKLEPHHLSDICELDLALNDSFLFMKVYQSLRLD